MPRGTKSQQLRNKPEMTNITTQKPHKTQNGTDSDCELKFPHFPSRKGNGETFTEHLFCDMFVCLFVCLLRFIRLSPPVNAAVLALVCRGYQPASPIIQYTTVEMLPGSLWFHGLLKLEWLQASTES